MVSDAALPAGVDLVDAGTCTGRYLVLLPDTEAGLQAGLAALKDVAGLASVCRASDYRDSAVDMTEADAADVLVLDQFNAAVIGVAEAAQLSGIQSVVDGRGAIQTLEPERYIYALPDQHSAELDLSYLRGYRDAVDHLYAQLAGQVVAPLLTGASDPRPAVPLRAALADTDQFTWGLQATRVHQSPRSGRGVRVAVLDSGVDLNHPDLALRLDPARMRSFVAGESVDDRHGHGTHCLGTAVGFQQLAGGSRRYGCAYGAEVYVGKVLDRTTRGTDGAMLAGINWAIASGCQVVSLSAGVSTRVGQSYSQQFEQVAQRALSRSPGCLLIAAAGNDSRWPGTDMRLEPPMPVSHPANCPSIMAVASVDAALRLAVSSNGGLNPQGGGVDLAAPGVQVFSSWPEPAPLAGRASRYRIDSGTSMAVPHVAGIAALWAEALGPRANAQLLWQSLMGNVRRLTIPSRDAGLGLVQAPGG
jgi:hypothetical protein